MRTLLATNHIAAATHAVLGARLVPAPILFEPRFLSAGEFILLRAVAARLFPQPNRKPPIELAPALDQRLAAHRGDGWRYAALLPGGAARHRGLNGFDEEAQQLYQHAHADKRMCQRWQAAGATDRWAFPRTAHVSGTARMGRRGDAAVVDAAGHAFEVPNLYISDNSTFPSALGVIPALTIRALSLRTADRFLARRRRHA